jgi:hypothetical protein
MMPGSTPARTGVVETPHLFLMGLVCVQRMDCYGRGLMN